MTSVALSGGFATIGDWSILALAIMANHIHLVVRVKGDLSAKKVLGDFKANGSRALTKKHGRPALATWWTYGGSKRELTNEQAIAVAIHYVLIRQYDPLLIGIPKAIHIHDEAGSGVE